MCPRCRTHRRHQFILVITVKACFSCQMDLGLRHLASPPRVPISTSLPTWLRIRGKIANQSLQQESFKQRQPLRGVPRGRSQADYPTPDSPPTTAQRASQNAKSPDAEDQVEVKPEKNQPHEDNTMSVRVRLSLSERRRPVTGGTLAANPAPVITFADVRARAPARRTSMPTCSRVSGRKSWAPTPRACASTSPTATSFATYGAPQADVFPVPRH